MTLAPKSLPSQDDRFILQMFILLQVAASPSVTHLKKDAAESHFPPLCFIFHHVKILGDAGVDLFKLEGKTVQENSFFLYSVLDFCPLKSPLRVFSQSLSLFGSSIVHLYPPSLVTFPPQRLVLPPFYSQYLPQNVEFVIKAAANIYVIKCSLGHLCSV